MRAERKKSLMIAGGVVVLIVIAAIIVALRFDINSYKPKIETAASEATGMDVRITGKMGLSFFPFGISAKNVHVANRGGEILSLESLKLRVKLIPLLKKCIRNLSIILLANDASLPLMRKLRNEGIFYHALKPVNGEDREELRQVVECAFQRFSENQE